MSVLYKSSLLVDLLSGFEYQIWQSFFTWPRGIWINRRTIQLLLTQFINNMHSPLALLVVMGAMAHTATAVGWVYLIASLHSYFLNLSSICTHFLPGSSTTTPKCDPSSCKARNIGVGETINDLSPGITCIFNSASDVGFDATVCGGTFLSGNCLQLSQLSSSVIDGDRNWQPPFPIFSMKRTGNWMHSNFKEEEFGYHSYTVFGFKLHHILTFFTLLLRIRYEFFSTASYCGLLCKQPLLSLFLVSPSSTSSSSMVNLNIKNGARWAPLIKQRPVQG